MTTTQYVLFDKMLVLADQEGVCAAIEAMVEEGRVGVYSEIDIRVVTKKLVELWKKESLA